MSLAGVAAKSRAAAALDRLARGQVVMCRPYRAVIGGFAWCRRADGIDLGCALVARGVARPAPPAWQPQRCTRARDMGRERIMD